MVHISESRALPTLEVPAQIDLREDLPTDRFYVEIEIPVDIEILERSIEQLTENYASKPSILETQFIGDYFVLQKATAILKIDYLAGIKKDAGIMVLRVL